MRRRVFYHLVSKFESSHRLHRSGRPFAPTIYWFMVSPLTQPTVSFSGTTVLPKAGLRPARSDLIDGAGA
jgi:hypothetical protein